MMAVYRCLNNRFQHSESLIWSAPVPGNVSHWNLLASLGWAFWCGLVAMLSIAMKENRGFKMLIDLNCLATIVKIYSHSRLVKMFQKYCMPLVDMCF